MDTTPRTAANEEIEETLRRSREQLRRKESYLDAIFEHAFQFLGLLSIEGTVLEANRSALEFVGATREEVVGRPFWDTPWWEGDPDQVVRLREAIDAAAHGHFARFEARHPGVGGRVAIVDFSLTPISDESGRVVLLLPEGRDITERKRREVSQQFLAEAGGIMAAGVGSRETLSSLLGLAVTSVADCCMLALGGGPGAAPHLDVAHAGPERPWFADPVREALERELPQPLRSALDTAQAVLVPDLAPAVLESCARDEEHLRALRALCAVSMMAVPLVTRGRSMGALAFLSSRPDRRYGPEDLRVATDLSQRLALMIENARLYQATCEALAARDAVLAVVAHDLRSPLGAIELAAASLLALPHDEGRLEQVRAASEVIRRSVARASRLIDDLLDVASIEAGRLSLERVSVSAADLVHEAAEALSPAVREANLEMEGAVEEALPAVLADRGRILQVFSNLVGNAIKFTRAGGRVGIAAERRGDEVCFSVSDTGVGIPAEHLPHVFDRFWQARRSDRRGAGQGLPIARGIVEAHGGRIWAESTPGQGSTFRFTLPL
jgi:PAS domain S-box-containing protein